MLAIVVVLRLQLKKSFGYNLTHSPFISKLINRNYKAVMYHMLFEGHWSVHLVNRVSTVKEARALTEIVVRRTNKRQLFQRCSLSIHKLLRCCSVFFSVDYC